MGGSNGFGFLMNVVWEREVQRIARGWGSAGDEFLPLVLYWRWKNRATDVRCT